MRNCSEVEVAEPNGAFSRSRDYFDYMCVILSSKVMDAAHEMSLATGVSWEARDDAPQNWAQLKAAVRQDGAVLPIYQGGLDSTVYSSKEAAIAVRYVHDMLHLQHDLDFTPPSEMMVARYQNEFLAGIGAGRAARQILWADFAGQTMCVAMTGTFPDDQKEFVYTAVSRGISTAIEMHHNGAFGKSEVAA